MASKHVETIHSQKSINMGKHSTVLWGHISSYTFHKAAFWA